MARPTEVIRVHREFKEVCEEIAKSQEVSLRDVTLLIARNLKKKKPVYAELVL